MPGLGQRVRRPGAWLHPSGFTAEEASFRQLGRAPGDWQEAGC